MTSDRIEKPATIRRRETRPPTASRSLLVVSGEGPTFKKSDYLATSLLDRDRIVRLDLSDTSDRPDLFSIFDLTSTRTGQPLLRSKTGAVPNLTSFSLDSILSKLDWSYDMLDLSHVWRNADGPPLQPSVIFLSTTLICNWPTLVRAIQWITQRYPGSELVVGGQYSNIKYEKVLTGLPQVRYVVRGDGERSIPEVLEMFDGHRSLPDVTNLVWRDRMGKIVANSIRYVDLDLEPSPGFGREGHNVVPYESMRGCPYVCRFCSFPHASPVWRYKSAEKINRDWRRYAELNGAHHVRAMDSTFTVPPKRIARLLPLLADSPVSWEAYSRANFIRSAALVAGLADAGCVKLSIGFESMSDRSLDAMKKKVSASDNRRAVDLLRSSSVGFRGSFMVGYPGETPERYEETAAYLRTNYYGHFMLSVFSLADETMPVWDDMDTYGMRIADAEDPDSAWEHSGMNSEEAHDLHGKTLDAVRRGQNGAVLLLWQSDYHTPLEPSKSRAVNMNLEKTLERLAMVERDEPDPRAARNLARRHLSELARDGIVRSPTTTTEHPVTAAVER